MFNLFLSFISAVLLSAGFLLPHCGGFALIGFVPLLWLDRLDNRMKGSHAWWWTYLAFLLWNVFTTFWVCNATVAGGIAACIINAALMGGVWALFRFSRRRFKGALPYIFLAAAWIAWEKLYFNAEVSWPWLTLGNAFARSTSCIQWYEVTGTLGGSLWIWLCNLAVFGITFVLQNGKWKEYNKAARTWFSIGTTAVFILPPVFSWVRYATYKPSDEGTAEVVLLQPSIDPYHKFEALTQQQQNDLLLSIMDPVLESVDSSARILFIAPETFTSDVILNNPWTSMTLNTLRNRLVKYENVNILLGASSYKLFYQHEAPSYTARSLGNDQWYEDYNSAVIIDRTLRFGLYNKSRLVVGVEKMPWPRFFSKIDRLLGGNVIGHCVGQEEASLLDFKPAIFDADRSEIIPFGCAVCYESVYPEYFASYVNKGAQFMTVITNDSWWGDTPGYHQHLSYSCLRAIETRRDIARCANSGISAFIDRRGDIVEKSTWNKTECIRGQVALSGEITPFVRYGDIVGRICTLVFCLLALLLVFRIKKY